MFTESPKLRILSGNSLKIIASVLMVIDHMGMMLFPDVVIFRIIGRICFPIFAFLIAEGAKHTKNKLRHILVMAGFGIAMQAVYFIFARSLEMNVLITFTLSLLIIYSMDFLKAAIFSETRSTAKIITGVALVMASLGFAVLFDRFFDLDYNLAGCLLPVFPSIFTTPKVSSPPNAFELVDTKTFRILATALGIATLTIDPNGIQYFAFLSVPILFLYSEKRGRLNMKYFFYVFYPLHLAILQGIAMLI